MAVLILQWHTCVKPPFSDFDTLVMYVYIRPVLGVRGQRYDLYFRRYLPIFGENLARSLATNDLVIFAA
jgi:hypothetical protein